MPYGYNNDFSSSFNNSSPLSRSNSLRLNYLFPGEHAENYGRKVYIFPSSQAAPESSGLLRYRSRTSHPTESLSNGKVSAAQSEQNSDHAPGSPAAPEKGSTTSSSCEDTADSITIYEQRVTNLQTLLRAEKECSREHEDTIISLRRTLDEHERRLHYMDGVASGNGRGCTTPDFVRASPVQKLLDQVGRLQMQKQDLLLKVAEYEHSLAVSARTRGGNPPHQVPPSKAVEMVSSNGQMNGQEMTRNSRENGHTSDAGQCSTDTEKELEKANQDRLTMDAEVKSLREENKQLKQRLSTMAATRPVDHHQSPPPATRAPRNSPPPLPSTPEKLVTDNMPNGVHHMNQPTGAPSSSEQTGSPPGLSPAAYRQQLLLSAAQQQAAATDAAHAIAKADISRRLELLKNRASSRTIQDGEETHSPLRQPNYNHVTDIAPVQQSSPDMFVGRAFRPVVIAGGSIRTSERASQTDLSDVINEHEPVHCDKCEELARLLPESAALKTELAAKCKEVEDLKAEFTMQQEENSRAATRSLQLLTQQKDEELRRLQTTLTSLLGTLQTVQQDFYGLKHTHTMLSGAVKNMLLAASVEQRDLQKQIQQSLVELSESKEEIVKKYQKEMRLRRKYHNQLVELRGNIRVLGRIRPWVSQDGSQIGEPVVTPDPDDEGVVYVTSKSRVQQFDLDKVFGMTSTQCQVFEEVSSLVRSVVDGYSVCIFAYGQTGAGKTYTMEGPDFDPGINQRALQLLFEEIQSPDWEYDITASVLEIYNENIRDLLNPDPGHKLEVKMKAEGGLHVPGLAQVPVTSLQDVDEVFETGKQHRATECTNMNERSSRSHCLLCITVLGRNLTTGSTSTGRLNLVDLAGSERLSRSQADGQRLKEAQNINRSLACLGDVMHALRTKQAHVPYRNSRLTYLLQDSLGGDSKTLMIVQVAPGERNAGETLCTLTFGQRVRAVELGAATRHIDVVSPSPSNLSRRSNSVLDMSFSSVGSISPCPSPSPSPSPSPCPSPVPFTSAAPSHLLQRTVSSPNPTHGNHRRRLPAPSSSTPPLRRPSAPAAATGASRPRFLSTNSTHLSVPSITASQRPKSQPVSPLLASAHKATSTPSLYRRTSSSSSSTKGASTGKSNTPTTSTPRSAVSERGSPEPADRGPMFSLPVMPLSPPSSTSSSPPPMLSPNGTPTPSPPASPSPNSTPNLTPTSSPVAKRRGPARPTTLGSRTTAFVATKPPKVGAKPSPSARRSVLTKSPGLDRWK